MVNSNTNLIGENNPDAWRPIKIGAGGYVTGIDIAEDGTRVVRTDFNGAYLWNAETKDWHELLMMSSLPEGATANDALGAGVFEIKIAPSNTDILYMTYNGYVYRSDNQGGNWEKTNLEQVNAEANGYSRLTGGKIAVDPLDSNTVFVATEKEGLFISRDGGTTWTHANDVATGAKDPTQMGAVGITGIMFDPASSANGHTNVAYAASTGNGVYKTTDGGETWNLLAGGPKDVNYAAITKDGEYYAVGDDSLKLWSFKNGTWTELQVTDTAHPFQSVAVDPFNEDHIIVNLTSGSQIKESFDGGTTWSYIPLPVITADDHNPQWITTLGGWLSGGGLMFDPTIPGKLVLSAGDGVWETTLTEPLQGDWLGGTVKWELQSVGIEGLTTNDIIVSKSGHPILANWDRAAFYVEDLEQYPDHYIVPGTPEGAATPFSAGWSLDYASSDPNFVVLLANWGSDHSGYSRDGGVTWTKFETSLDGNFTLGGSIAASTPDNIIWAPANAKEPYYTLDGGKTWNEIKLPDGNGWDTFHWAYYLNRTTVTADRVEPNTFYLYDVEIRNNVASGGLYKTTDGGVTWLKVFEGEIQASSTYNAKIQSVPGHAGHLFFTGGQQGGEGPSPYETFRHSTDGGVTWHVIDNVREVLAFGYGAPATPDGYPALFIAGWVDGQRGIYQSDDEGATWMKLGSFPDGSVLNISSISGDPGIYGQVYVGLSSGGYVYLAGRDPGTEPVITDPVVVTDPSTPIDHMPSDPVVTDPVVVPDPLVTDPVVTYPVVPPVVPDAVPDPLTGHEGNDDIRGGDGNEIIHGGAGDDILYGQNGNDEIHGGVGHDMLLGGDGNDVLFGDAGDDKLYGENGNDELHGGAGNDFLSGGDGNDVLFGDDGNDDLRGGDGNDVIHGGTGDDILYGENGNDELHGGDGKDLMTGGDGNDVLFGDNGDDKLYGDAGNDELHGGLGNDFVAGGSGHDTLFGDEGNDDLRGGEGHDVLYGGSGDDYLYGEDGNDELHGGAGNDMLIGGAGADVFVFDKESLGSNDRIADFNASEGDKIDISHILEGYDPATDAIANFVRLVGDGTDKQLQVDVSGSGHDFVTVASFATAAPSDDVNTLVNQGSLVA